MVFVYEEVGHFARIMVEWSLIMFMHAHLHQGWVLREGGGGYFLDGSKEKWAHENTGFTLIYKSHI